MSRKEGSSCRAIEPDVSKYWFEKLLQLVVRRDFFPFPHRVGRLMLLASILSRRVLCLVGIENLPASPSHDNSRWDQIRSDTSRRSKRVCRSTAEPSGSGDGNEDSFVGHGREAVKSIHKSRIKWRYLVKVPKDFRIVPRRFPRGAYTPRSNQIF
jgi:hypothetical protein